MKQDGCHKFVNEDEAPIEKKVNRNYEKYKQKIQVRKIFEDRHSKGEFHLLVTFLRQILQYLACATERESLFASMPLADRALCQIFKVDVILPISELLIL